MKKYIAYHVLILTSLLTFSQEISNIKNPGNDLRKKCQDYLSIYEKLPTEVRYSVIVRERMIYFYFNEYYFDLLFDSNTDGIAIDIVKRNQYKCYEKNQLAKSPINKGLLMPPMYLKEIVGSAYRKDGYVIIPYGELPTKFEEKEIECNLLVIQKKYLCSYHVISNIDFSNWSVLEMGLYKDSLSRAAIEKVETSVSKSLRFTIPFEKNRSEFDSKDIQPLYDSLQLTDFNIKHMTIRAYTSVEGSEANNIKLQRRRSESLIQALQKFQTPEISSDVIAKENWVEFLNDIRGTDFEYLIPLSKKEIKKELSEDNLKNKLEPLLSSHRKGLIQLELQKKFTNEENNAELLKKYFNQNIKEKNIDEALYIQSIILEKIRDEQIPDDFIDDLEIPNESLFGPLLNNFSIFNYEKNDIFLYENISNFERLLEILPDNKKILYNITALKIKAWREGELITNENEIKTLINRLRSLKLEKRLIDRLWVNYNMILSEYRQREGDYKKKNLALKNVYATYQKIDLSDSDLLSMAKYLSWYSKFDWAEKAVNDRVHEVDVAENLVFYYLSLTIGNPAETKQSDYRTFMLNAIDKNNQRFCDLFLPKAQGGHTFQLLDDQFLRKTYCENCDYSNFQ